MMEDSISGFKKYEFVWKVLGLVVGLATCCAGESKQWTMDELTTSKVPHKMSSDVYQDPLKSGAFGGVIEKPIGTIVSPSFPNLYPPNKTCIWEINAPPKHKIFLKFTDFDVENGTQDCEYDSVNITSKNANDEDINLGVFCGSNLPSNIYTECNYLRIEFRSDESIQKSGFGAFFISYINPCATNNGGCQQICKNTRGSYKCFCHNGYKLHENQHDCEDIDECAANNNRCQQICNNTIGSYLCSCRNGYKLHENLHDCEVPCGGVIKKPIGTIFSPFFPNPYPRNITCIWEITVRPKFRIVLNFTYFNIEGNFGIDKKCEYGRVNITSKVSDDEHKMHGVFCGSRLPPLIISEGNSLRIEFSSGNLYGGSGFIANFFFGMNECAINNGRCQQICNNTIRSHICSCRNGYELQENLRDCEVIVPCGGVIEETNGTISSPLFPDPYPVNKICIWEIIAPPQYRIILKFTHFDIVASYAIYKKCLYDSVTITSKVAEDEDKMHGVFCSSGLPPLITSESNALRIEFRSNWFIQKSGFSAYFFSDIDECAADNGGCQQICVNTIGSYKCSCWYGYKLHENLHDCEISCGGVIKETSGTIFSPLFPDPYPKNKTCIWEIKSPPQYRIFLKFTHFDVQGDHRKDKKCEYDRVNITSKVADDEIRMHGVFCGSRLPPLITSVGNALRIEFSSDDSDQRSGFSAFFFIDPCDSVTDQTTVHIVIDVMISGCAKCDLTRLAFHVFLLYLCLWH